MPYDQHSDFDHPKGAKQQCEKQVHQQMSVHCNTPTTVYISNTPTQLALYNYNYTPLKFHSSPLKNDGWKTAFLREGFLFRGELLNLGRVSQWNATKTMVFSTFPYFTPPRKSCGKFRRTIPRSFVGRRGHGWRCVSGGRTVATKSWDRPWSTDVGPRWRKAFFQKNTCCSTRPCENWWKKES